MEHDRLLSTDRERSWSARSAGKPSAHRAAMIVMDYLGRGLGPEDVVRHYPYLTLAEVHSAMTYYHDHRNEIDSEIQGELDQLKDSVDANSHSAIWKKLKASGVI